MGKSAYAHAPGAAYHSSGSRGAHKERTNTVTRTGRPKTGSGHRDDAMLGLIDLRGKVAEVVKCDQSHYRERRDLMTEIDEMLRDAQVSWRYGEIADSLNESTAGQIAARLRGES